MRKMIGSIYTRFILSFLGAFLFSLLVAALFIHLTQLNPIIESVNQSIISKAEQINRLAKEENMTAKKAASYFSSDELQVFVYDSLNETKINFTMEQKENIEGNHVIIKCNVINRSKYFYLGIIKIDNKYVVIKPDFEKSPIAILLKTQRYIVILPIILGTLLIILAVFAVVKPIKRISNAAVKVAKGDFTIELPVKGQDEVSDLTRNFNLMVRALSTNEYLHKDFVSNVSHEFKTPLTSLRGYAKLLKEPNLPEEKLQECTNIIIEESDRLSKLSSNLLRLAELENNAIGLKKETFSLDEQIRDAILLLQNAWEQKNIDLDIEMEEVECTGDKGLLYQVWVNLISNAIKYSNENGTLKIRLNQKDKAIFEITDNGIGMTSQDCESIFKRFYKADKSRNSYGTGLGLPIALRIVELHGGTIGVESELEKGSKFTVVI